MTDDPTVGMAYGRVSVAPASFLKDAFVTVLRRETTDSPVRETLAGEAPGLLKRIVFRGSVGSDYGKNLRWRLETLLGQTGGELHSRNQIMNVPSEWFSNREPGHTEILHEYFVPSGKLAGFFEKARPILLRHHCDLLNITIRAVEKDEVTALNYAREEVFGLVMLFHQRCDESSEAAMASLSRDLIDAALDCGGTYYLPYRPHATVEQFRRAYPQAKAFFEQKRRYDPNGIFRNQYFAKYGELGR